MAFPVGCCLGRRGGFACRATVSPLHDHRIVLTAPLCYTVALPICCGCHCYCRTAPPHRSVTAPLLPLRYCRDAAPLRACCRHRAAPLRPRRSAAAVLLLLPPTALLLLRSSTLPRCSAPRRSVSLCYMLPALHRAASLLRCCRADSLLPLHSPSPSRMRLNQSLWFSSPLASVSVSVSVPVPVSVSVSVSVSGVRAVFAVTDGGEQNDVVLR